ncbi:uncharacterized protein BDR25DRAFT_360461 [Lindgomyces ingoldianus]|uniref:Uncharacterized protein n=1 Tax=Lindgomyces ingoldianus TaxID=673940 RepID=A0ACB6QF10_9PLEO|nr:uncharacterized protein BDR25DRAFT_360461 [Lindgomyces ingoldianus]KAF2465511.1 hypothetical protein BDR25DRAFT_360461 [Lindgomyces ingoldianus]
MGIRLSHYTRFHISTHQRLNDFKVATCVHCTEKVIREAAFGFSGREIEYSVYPTTEGENLCLIRAGTKLETTCLPRNDGRHFVRAYMYLVERKNWNSPKSFEQYKLLDSMNRPIMSNTLKLVYKPLKPLYIVIGELALHGKTIWADIDSGVEKTFKEVGKVTLWFGIINQVSFRVRKIWEAEREEKDRGENP